MRTNTRGGAVVAAVLTAVMVTWFVLSMQLELIHDGKPGPGLYPAVLAGVGLVFAGVIVVAELRGWLAGRPVAEPGHEPESAQAATTVDGKPPVPEGEAVEEHGRGEIVRPLGALAGLIGFLVLVPVLGFMLALLLVLASVSLALIRMPWRRGVAVSLGTTLFVYLVFDLLLAVPFPTGILGI